MVPDSCEWRNANGNLNEYSPQCIKTSAGYDIRASCVELCVCFSNLQHGNLRQLGACLRKQNKP